MLKPFLAAVLIALVSTATTEAGASFVFQKTSFSGVVNIGGSDPSEQGRVKLTTTTTGKYSISGKLGARRFSTRGEFDSTGHEEKEIVIRVFGFVVATIKLDLQISPDGESIACSVEVNGDQYNFTLNRAFYSKDNPTAVAGYFTALLTSPGGDFPGGTGYAGITVKPGGGVRLVGRLADGSVITGGGVLFKEDRFAVAAILYGKRGAIGGFVDFSSNDAATGSLAWVRLAEATPDVLMPAVFSGNVSIVVNRYTRPDANTIALPGTDLAGQATISLLGGNQTANLAKDVTINTRNKVAVVTRGDDKLEATIGVRSGIVTGNATLDLGGTTKKVIFRGIISQPNNKAEGYFIGLDQSGVFQFTPDL